MNFQLRKQKILALLHAKGEVATGELAQTLGISEITIRRDLNQLSDDGLLYRTHGGAIPVTEPDSPFEFVNKAAANQAAKDKICRKAAAEINDGDIIFMDCGSTVFRLCQFIKNKKIKVITNSLPVIFELQHSAVSLNIIGGEYDAARQAIHGTMATEHIQRYKAGKAFIGVDGLSGQGLFAHSEKEAAIATALATQSDYTYLLCDAGKIGKTSYLNFAGLDLVDAIITDGDPAALKYCKKKGVKVISA
ncbi:DeoR/GlpR family DNA-binding transcription regulator [Chitinophaga sp. RCC_12]|uniref:DeoR/GlpR family DNA-binding transcription regulator n=1 Tax=Chitinophaga sp. RCC_12 TaxID=3239226 RepID=UPI003524C52D